MSTGAPRDDLTAAEIAERLSRPGVEKLRFVLSHGECSLEIELGLSATDSSAVAVHAPFTNGRATSRLWLQSDADVVAPIKVVALPTTTNGLALDAAHALVGLAEGAIVAWVSGLLAPPKPSAPEAGWWELYDVLTRRPREALAELHAHLAAQFDILFAWTLAEITRAPEGTSVVAPEAGAIARLVPEVVSRHDSPAVHQLGTMRNSAQFC